MIPVLFGLIVQPYATFLYEDFRDPVFKSYSKTNYTKQMKKT